MPALGVKVMTSVPGFGYCGTRPKRLHNAILANPLPVFLVRFTVLVHLRHKAIVPDTPAEPVSSADVPVVFAQADALVAIPAKRADAKSLPDAVEV